MGRYFVNVSRLCGHQSLFVWDDVISDFGECFTSLALITPVHVIMAITVAYKLGRITNNYYLRTKCQKLAVAMRAVITLTMAINPIVANIILVATRTQILKLEGYSDIIETTSQTLSWILMFVYNVYLMERVHPSARGHKVLRVLWVMSVVVDMIQSRSILLLYDPDNSIHTTRIAYAIVQIVCHTLYLLSLLPSSSHWPPEGESNYEELIVNGEATPLLGHPPGGSGLPGVIYGEPHDPNYLGVAKETSNWLSNLLFYWVYPLIRKGRRGRIKSGDDVFDLPTDLSAPIASETFQNAKEMNDNNLMKIFIKMYWKPFLLIGSLKFLADCAGFANPLLLNAVITFMENPQEDIRWGYLYAAGLLGSTVASTLLTTHFNMYMNELTLKIRASMVTAIYKHTVDMPGYRLTEGGFSLGQVINFVGTDTDRIVNFCPSFHAMWSLPFQFAVTIFLLYQQVQWAFWPGLVVALAMIFINRFIMKAIVVYRCVRNNCNDSVAQPFISIAQRAYR